MPRMIDDILTYGLSAPPWVPLTKDNKELMGNYFDTVFKVLPSIPVIVIDNVAEYIWKITDKEVWDIGKDFPCMAPPFPVFWIEYKYPSIIRSYGKLVERTEESAIQTGVLFYADVNNLTNSESYWKVTAMSYSKFRENHGIHQILGPLAICEMLLDKFGNPIEYPIISIPAVKGVKIDYAIAEKELPNIFSASFFVSPCMSLSLMNCKNVKKEMKEPDAPLSKKYEKRHGRPLQKFYTLVIDPMKELLKRQGEAEKTGIRKALHICRGHFADYSEGNGLFGKYHGRYWMPSHIRGKRSFGTVEKDYAVKRGMKAE